MFESITKKRKNTTPWWVVIPVMLVIGTLVGLRTCRMIEKDEEHRAPREQQLQPR
jgi:hypothetical protein